MDARDVFSLNGKCRSHNFLGDLLFYYWSLELMVADECDAPFSSLELYGAPANRTCGLCGTVCKTQEYGSIYQCDYDKCRALRSFWGISGAIKFNHISSSGDRSARYGYLKLRMARTIGCATLSEIPPGIRFDFLLSAMVERVAHEKNHSRAA